MSGTTIDTSGTVGILLTLPSQNPVLVTSTGTIITTGFYAIDDTAADNASSTDEINNYGLLQGQDGIEFNGSSAAGVVNNFGRIVGADNAIYAQDGSVVVNGSATDTTASITSEIAGAISFGSTAEGGDLVINYGTISGPEGGISLGAGQTDQVVNYNTISGGGGYGVVIYGTAAATVTNGGATDTTASITGGIDFDDPPGAQLANFGKITGNILFVNDGTVMNGGTSDSAASIAGEIDFGGGSGANAVTNYGIISGVLGIDAGATGRTTVINSGTITGTATGIFATTATVTNTGSVSGPEEGIDLGANSSITNGSTGDTTASVTGGTAIAIAGTGTSEVTNYGTITGGAGGTGIETASSGQSTITNGSTADTTALITGDDGVAAAGKATLLNFGSIQGGDDGLVLAGGSSITNGSAADTAASIKGYAGGVYINSAGSITFNNFGTVASTASAGDGVYMTGNITNGSASDGKATISANGWAVDDASGTVANFGTIHGDVFLGAGTLTNVGTISVGTIGGVEIFSAGTIVNSGTIASGATSSPALGLYSAGSLVNATGGFIGYTHGSVATAVNDGIIEVRSDDSLDVSSAIDPSSNGVFQLTGHSSFEVAAYLGTALKIQFLGSTPTNELIIDNAAKFGTNIGSPSYAGPLLESFVAGDVIDLKGIASTGIALSYSALNGDLQVTSGGKDVATLAFQNATLGAGSFHATSDGGRGTLITHS